MVKSTPPNHVKKPNNAFMLYRKDKKDEIMAKFGITKSHEISKEAGLMWKVETPYVKMHYKQIADELFAKHKEMYPDYIWPSKASNKPSKVSKKKAAIVPPSPSISSYSELSDQLHCNTPTPSDLKLDTYFPPLLSIPYDPSSDYSYGWSPAISSPGYDSYGSFMPISPVYDSFLVDAPPASPESWDTLTTTF